MRIALSLAAIFAATLAHAADAQPPAAPPLPPELKVFERSIGTWDREMHLFPSESTSTEQRLKGHEKHEWVLGGRYLQITIFKPDGQPDSIFLATFDSEKKSYQAWQFTPRFTLQSQGKLDEKTQTMNWTGEPRSGLVAKGSVRFVNDDTRVAELETRGSDGKLYFKMETKLTRRK